MATMLAQVGSSAQGRSAPAYPLAVAAQDALLGFAVQQSVATGGPGRTAREPGAGA